MAAAFLALGLALAVSSEALPEGVGRLPGPGFFPRLIGGAMTLLSLTLLWRSRSGSATPSAAEEPADIRGVLGAIGLLTLYLLLWGSGLFAVRTVIFLSVLLRFLGQPWKTALGVAIPVTAALVLAFQIGLGVSLE